MALACNSDRLTTHLLLAKATCEDKMMWINQVTDHRTAGVVWVCPEIQGSLNLSTVLNHWVFIYDHFLLP